VNEETSDLRDLSGGIGKNQYGGIIAWRTEEKVDLNAKNFLMIQIVEIANAYRNGNPKSHLKKRKSAATLKRISTYFNLLRGMSNGQNRWNLIF